MPSYMVLGGCGFVGRNLVHYLISEQLCDKLVVADKSRPELSWLTPDQKKCFDDPMVTFKQVNLSNQNSVLKLFSTHPCDYVINSAAETRLGMSAQVYDEHIYKLGIRCAEQAAAIGTKKYIQLSSARVQQIAKSARDDSTTEILKCQLKLEESLKTIQGLNYGIIRPALVYGSSDKRGLTPLLIMGAIYKKIGEEMKLLWTKDVYINTVHVYDVVRACLHLASLADKGAVFDVGDKSNSTQGSIASLVSDIFKIKHEFVGTMKSTLAKNFFEDVIDDINQKHMVPWSEACTAEGIVNTPLNPYVTEEQLMLDDSTVNGSMIESTGFTYKYPTLGITELKKVIQEYVDQKLFPKCCMP